MRVNHVVSTKMINVLVIDAGLGNIGSVINAVERAGANVITKRESKYINEESISHIVLPGVGTYNQGMKSLNEKGWDTWIKATTKERKIPILGICLGMQLMSDNGSEGKETSENIEGLGLIGGTVEKITKKNLRLPHIGWNNVKWRLKGKEMEAAIGKETDYYFVHSYHFVANKEENIIGTVDYGEEIVAAIKYNNIIGVQFHPEKSQKAGAQLIKYFIGLT